MERVTVRDDCLNTFFLIFSLAYITDVFIPRSYYYTNVWSDKLEECIKLCTDSPKCDLSEYCFDTRSCQLFGYDDAKRPFKDAVSGDLYCNPGSRENCK